MFHSAAVKLTVWYLAIIMALSATTSFAIYHVSSNRLAENAYRQIGYFRGLLGTDAAAEFASLRNKQLNEDRHRLRANLVVFNLMVFGIGGAAAYVLARQTLRPIEEALEAQKRFTADASHELRTPLTAIQTENEVALRNANLSKSEAIKLLKSNLEEVAKLKSLSEGLLALSRGESDEDFNDLVSIGDVIKDAYERIAKAAALKNIKIVLPKRFAQITVKGNFQKLTDLVAILLDNAVKYSPSGKRVKVEVQSTSKYVSVAIYDQGQGIMPNDLPKIFDRFYRADNGRTKTEAGGYGLGLAIAKKIADAHHGVIEVKSVVKKGSVFSVKLPLAKK